MPVVYPVRYPDAAEYLIVADEVYGIPPHQAFDLVDRRKLAQALAAPRLKVDGVEVFDEFLSKVAAYGWQLLRRPPIPSGARSSRAIAFLCMDLFLSAHGLELRGEARNVDRVLGEVGNFKLSLEGLHAWVRTRVSRPLPEANNPHRLIPLATAEGKFLGRAIEVFSRLQMNFRGDGEFLGVPITVLASLWQVGPTPTRLRSGIQMFGGEVRIEIMHGVDDGKKFAVWKGGFVGWPFNDGFASRARATGLLVEVRDGAPDDFFSLESVGTIIQVDVERNLKYRLKMWALPMSAL